MASVEQLLERIADSVEQIAAAVAPGRGSPEPPVELQPPAGFTATWDAAARTVTCRWEPVPYVVEIHEFDADPDTLAATMPPGATERTSGRLRGGHTYTYAARCVDGDQVSEWTERITLDIPLEGGGEVPSESDEDDGQDDDEPPPGGPHPHEVLDLQHWTIMLPVGSEGDPDNDYARDWGTIPGVFFVQDDGGVVFRTPADGVHSPNSKYPRTEARQMADADWTKAAWSSSGEHSISFELAIDASHLEARPRINAVQIHDGGDDVCQLMLREDGLLGIAHDDGDSFEPIGAYENGSRLAGRLTAANDRITLDLDGRRVVDIPKRGSGWYFKIGSYVQTGGSSEHHEPAGAYGQVTVYSFSTTGNPLA